MRDAAVTDPIAKAKRALVWPLRLTWAGLWAERGAQAFWPLWSLMLLGFALVSFGAFAAASLWGARAGAGLWLALALSALIWGLRRFRAPKYRDAWARLDQSLPDHPLSALSDAQLLGADDPAARAIWAHHQRRMAARVTGLAPVSPELNLARRDRFGLRYMALTLAVVGALFGATWRGAGLSDLGAGPAAAMPQLGAWEAWARPPAYTKLPAIYLNEAPAGALHLPQGSTVSVRLYGAETGLRLAQDIGTSVPSDDGFSFEFKAEAEGPLAIEGEGGRAWQVTLIPDRAPEVAASGEVVRGKAGRFQLGFTARDDYGVARGAAELSLDLAQIPRRHGLAIEPEPQAPQKLDLPVRGGKGRMQIDAQLEDDLSETLLANMPVSVRLHVEDDAGQSGESAARAAQLPAKRFFEPMAAAVAELRRDVLWNRVNIDRSAQILRALIYAPDTGSAAQSGSKRLRVLLREIDHMARPLADSDRDFVVGELWRIALFYEEGELGSAFERFERAQQRLEEAIRNGASPEEVEDLMAELQRALRDYMREKAKEAGPSEGRQEGGESREVTQDQIQELLDEIERLTKEGRTAEAMERMEQLRQLMENLQMQQGQGQGEGEGAGQGQGQGGMQGLGEALRDQQNLSDEAYRNLQRGRQGQGGGRSSADLAESQRDLREELDGLQNQRLPGDGTAQGEAGRERLGEAERAMREAEEALREGNLRGAMSHQADALDALREGIRDLNEAERARRGGQGDDGPAERGRGHATEVDPLGRGLGEGARQGNDQNMVENSPDRRAQRLLDEIRRRSGEALRPESERDYLRRLLDLF